MNIAVATSVNPACAEQLKEIAPDFEIRIVPNASALDEHLDWIEVVFGNISPEQIARASRLRWVQLTSSGFEPYLSLSDTPIKLTTARGITSRAGAEYVLSMMLMFTRRMPLFMQRQRERKWDRNIQAVGSLVGQTLGLIGFGANADALARRAKAMEMRVLAVKRTPATAPDYVDALWTTERLDEMLEQSDHVAVMIPLTNETRGLIDEGKLHRMKRGAYLYNISRGGIVDERVLIEGLRDGRLGGAALDVFDTEPLPPESPLWEMENVIITPHLGAAWGGMWDAAFDLFRDNLRRFINNEPLQNMAQFERGY